MSPRKKRSLNSHQSKNPGRSSIKDGLQGKPSRVEDAEPSFSSSFNDFADIFDGLDLPQSVVERRTDIEKPGEPEKQAEDCHDFYGQIQWCDEIIAKVSIFFSFRLFL